MSNAGSGRLRMIGRDESAYWKGEAKRLEIELGVCRKERDVALQQARESRSAEFALRSEVKDLRAKVAMLDGPRPVG